MQGKNQTANWSPNWPLIELRDYLSFFSSFLTSSLCGLHFSQDLPSLWAATQHLCVHSLPSALAFSQQVCFLSLVSFDEESAAIAGPARIASAHTTALRVLMSFIFFVLRHLLGCLFSSHPSICCDYPIVSQRDWIGRSLGIQAQTCPYPFGLQKTLGYSTL